MIHVAVVACGAWLALYGAECLLGRLFALGVATGGLVMGAISLALWPDRKPNEERP